MVPDARASLEAREIPTPVAAEERRLSRSRILDAFTILAFVGYSLVMAWRHEPWRDEAQAWVIARDAPSLLAMLGLMGYEGSPALWHLLLRPFAQLGLPVFSMALLHVAIVSTAVTAVFLWGPFSRLEKTLLVTGYFFLYEYNVIARSYSLSALFLLLVAATYRERHERPLRYAVALMLLGQTNVHSTIIAGVFAASFGLEWFARRSQAPLRALAWPFGLLGAGFLAAAWQLRPPADLAPHLSEWRSLGANTIRDLHRFVTDAFVPIPVDRPSFWGFSWAAETFEVHAASTDPWELLLHYSMGAATLAAFLLSLSMLWDNRRLFVIYLVAFGGVISVFLLKYPGYIRHHGLLFMLWLACVWASRTEGVRPVSERLARRAGWAFSPAGRKAVIALLLAVQVAATPVAIANEWQHPFSGARETAEFLRGSGYLSADTLIASHSSSQMAGVLAHLPEETRGVYMLEYGRYGSYMVWDRLYWENWHAPIDVLMERMDDAKEDGGFDRVVFLTHLRHMDPDFLQRYRLVAVFEGRIAGEETIHVYEQVAPRGTATMP